MFRERRKQLRRRRRRAVTGVAVAVTAFVVGVPTLAAADPVSDLLHNLGLGGTPPTTGSTDSSGTATPNSGTPPDYVPPMHGTNPHGEGTDAVVDLTPQDTNPYPADQSGEDIVVGDTRGEQNADGTYHGSVTLANVLGITIPGLTTIETNPGETNDGPLGPLNDALDDLCTASTVCLTLLDMHSDTTATGSHNSFTAADLSLGGTSGTPAPISATALSSNGNISSDGTCQTSHGDSQVAGALVGSQAAGITADTLDASSDSTACNDGTKTTNQSSHVLGLGGVLAGVDIPVTSTGCENGTPNSTPSILGLGTVLSTLGVASLTCNADDTNGSQAGAPYGVRESLAIGLLADLLPIRIAGAGPESHAVAPGTTTNPPTNPGGGGGGGNKGAGGSGGNGNGGGNGGGAGNGPAAGTAAPGNGQLAFTGADLLALALVGGALILGGLALTTTAGRRHRQTI